MCSSQSTVGGFVLLFQQRTELSFLGNHRFRFICIYFGILVSSREVFFRNICVQGQWVWVLAVWRFCFFEPTTWTSGLNVPRQNASAHVGLTFPHPRSVHTVHVCGGGGGSVLFSGGEPWLCSQTLACPTHVQA